MTIGAATDQPDMMRTQVDCMAQCFVALNELGQALAQDQCEIGMKHSRRYSCAFKPLQ
jgi:hypothetical protein